MARLTPDSSRKSRRRGSRRSARLRNHARKERTRGVSRSEACSVFFCAQPEAHHRPVHGWDRDAQAALALDQVAQLRERQVVLLTDEPRHEPQSRRVEGAALAARTRERREAAGLAPAAQQALDEGAADAEAGGKGAP